MVIDKKVSKPELAVEAITAKSDPLIVAALKTLNFQVCFVAVILIHDLKCFYSVHFMNIYA